ncbi:MAG: protein-disulfide reductase DsbD [Pseudomonadota bacterium]
MTGHTKPGKRPARLAGWFLLVAGAMLLNYQTAALAQLTGGGAFPQEKASELQGFSNSFQQPEFLPVEEAYVLAVEAEDATTLRLVWQMPPGYYLYQHAFDFSLARNDTAIGLEHEYPPALTREDEYFGRVQVYYDSADITLRAENAVPGTRLAITSQGCADAGLCYPPRTQFFLVDAQGTVLEAAAPLATRAGADRPANSAGGSTSALWFMLLLAFAGGLILNLMPCVLPVLSLKVLGFAMACPEERHRHGQLYSLGVVLSFLAIAVVLLSLRSTGQAIGWGFQLQSPTVVLSLAYLFVVLGLAMSGVLELGNRFMNLGSDLCDKGGARGSFFTGVLAVVVASPCTAPFMGTALGYALVQPAHIGLAVFAALGCGMALPMLLLSYSETARRHMPKPGPWMERLKQGLAFPLYATALWLFWVAGRQTGVDVMAAALLGALVLALGLWLWRGAWFARSVSLLCLGVAVFLVSWRPTAISPEDSSLPEGAVAYSPQVLEELRAAGQPVFVDVTADWCITCLANERAVLDTAAVQDAFRANGVTYMIADWTDYDPTIADFVSSHGRSGIPLYVLYSRNDEPRLLPQILRRSTVLSALDTVSENSLATARD